MIDIKQISFAYSRKKKAVFDDFSLSLDKGRIYGLLGVNGAGKSTLLYLMSGLLTPKTGSVELKGINVRRRLPVTQQEIFLIPEEFELPEISLKNYIKMYSVFYPRFSQEDMDKYMHLFEMEQDMNLKHLSMGQKKKVYMSFALATNTSVLLMDEPTNGLDIPSKSLFRKFIALGMTEEKMILISTHQVRDIGTMLDHIVIINDNKVLLNRAINEDDSKIDLEQLFNDTLAKHQTGGMVYGHE